MSVYSTICLNKRPLAWASQQTPFGLDFHIGIKFFSISFTKISYTTIQQTMILGGIAALIKGFTPGKPRNFLLEKQEK